MKNVLVLDDDRDFHELVTPLIEARGRRCFAVSTLTDALVVAQDHEIELAISDYLLPDGNGGEFVAALRARGSKAILICLSASITGWALYERMQAEHEIRLVLRKPLFPKSFGDQLDALLPIDKEPRAPSAFMSARLAGIHEKYLQALPGKVEALALAIVRARAAQTEVSQLAEVTSLAHRLHGSAASYGCSGVGQAAGRIEHIMEELISGGRRFGADAWTEMDSAVDLARASLNGEHHVPRA